MTATELMAAFAAGMIAFVIYWCWKIMRLERRSRITNHPRAVHPENEARLTDSLVRKLIRQNNQPVSGLDECEREISK